MNGIFFIICRFTNGLNLYITPIVLDNFFDKLFTWSFQLRVESIIIPRYLIFCFCRIAFLWIFIVTLYFKGLLKGWKIKKLVFSILRASLLTES